jgi:hypothetical protein
MNAPGRCSIVHYAHPVGNKSHCCRGTSSVVSNEEEEEENVFN